MLTYWVFSLCQILLLLLSDPESLVYKRDSIWPACWTHNQGTAFQTPSLSEIYRINEKSLNFLLRIHNPLSMLRTKEQTSNVTVANVMDIMKTWIHENFRFFLFFKHLATLLMYGIKCIQCMFMLFMYKLKSVFLYTCYDNQTFSKT